MTSYYKDDKSEADKKAAKAKAKLPPKMPSGGTVVAAAPGYSVVTAVKSEAGVLSFPPPLTVIAWSISSDIAYPVTAIPIAEDALHAATVQTDGRVLSEDGTVYPGGDEWKAAVQAEHDAAKALEDDAAAKAKAEAKGKAA